MDSPFVVSAGQLAVGTCEIVMLNRDSSVPRCTIAHQTARCACRRGQIAGTTKARPACVDVRIVRSRQWCEMAPCLEGEVCGLLFNRSGWTCTKGSGHIKTVTVRCSLRESCMDINNLTLTSTFSYTCSVHQSIHKQFILKVLTTEQHFLSGLIGHIKCLRNSSIFYIKCRLLLLDRCQKS
ncbi:unnamed protein product [Coregonus sp. 'balchen']|nr:unnamed protein product [Coregonus sp. 'balchen']